MESIFSLGVLSAMVRIATPVTLAALGGLMCHKAGVLNIALEGLMLVGAFGAIVFIKLAGGSVWVGYLGAILCAVLVSLIFALTALKFKANQIIAGIAINLLAAGLTAFTIRAAFGTQGTLTPDVMNKIEQVSIPLLKDIPVLGDMLGRHYPLVYLSLALVVVTSILLYKTSYGLNVQSIGESEDAARTAGLKVGRIQLSVIIWSGALCGIAGAYLSTSMVSEFTENMVQGRGFTAFTAIVFSNGQPVITWLVTLLFGFAEAVGIRIELKGTGLSSSIVQMFPYILALIVLTVSSYMRVKRHSIGKTRKIEVQKL